VNSLPKTVTRQHHGCDLNPGPTAPESSTLTTRQTCNIMTCFMQTCNISTSFKYFVNSIFYVLHDIVHQTELC